MIGNIQLNVPRTSWLGALQTSVVGGITSPHYTAFECCLKAFFIVCSFCFCCVLACSCCCVFLLPPAAASSPLLCCLAASGLNYFQSVTPKLSAGGEVFWLPAQMRSGVGLCVRHQGDKHIATVQAASTGILSAQYAHRVTDKVCWCGLGVGAGQHWLFVVAHHFRAAPAETLALQWPVLSVGSGSSRTAPKSYHPTVDNKACNVLMLPPLLPAVTAATFAVAIAAGDAGE